MKSIILDVETGGLDPNIHSLLTVGLVCMEDGKVLDSLELKIKNVNYIVTAEAMKINKLDLLNIHETGCWAEEAVSRIDEFMIKHKGDKQAVLIGHNINFDISFLKKLYAQAYKNYSANISHRSLDTASIIRFLTMSDAWDGKELNSLDDVVNYFEIQIEDRHTALGDAIVTGRVLHKMIEKKKEA